MKTTLNEIRSFVPCVLGWRRLLTYLDKTKEDDEPLDFMTILAAVGIEDTIWCLRTQDYRDYCLFLADVAESVLSIFEDEYPTDDRPRKAIAAIRAWHLGELTKNGLAAAYAYDAADAAYAAAKKKNQKLTADICRKNLPINLWDQSQF